MYKSTPITKKAKTASEYNSALKQTLLDTSAQMFKDSEKEPFQIITKDVEKGTEGTADVTKEVPGKIIKAATDQCQTDASGKNIDTRKSCQQLANMTDEERKAAEVKAGFREKDTVVVEKGKAATPDETTYNATEIMRKDQGKNVGNLENREMNRVIKKAGKDVRRGEAKKARIENKKAKFENKLKRDEDDNIIAPKAGEKGYRKYKRLQAKETETTSELGGFQDRMDNALAGQASGKGLNENYRRADVAKTAADFDDDVQVKQDQLKQDMAKAAQSDSKRLANEAIKIGTGGFTLAPADTTAGNAFINKFKSPFGMNRTPMKKNYFKK